MGTGEGLSSFHICSLITNLRAAGGVTLQEIRLKVLMDYEDHLGRKTREKYKTIISLAPLSKPRGTAAHAGRPKK